MSLHWQPKMAQTTEGWYGIVNAQIFYKMSLKYKG